jgi:hypothetical protein
MRVNIIDRVEGFTGQPGSIKVIDVAVFCVEEIEHVNREFQVFREP